jgi:hypothetical protein
MAKSGSACSARSASAKHLVGPERSPDRLVVGEVPNGPAVIYRRTGNLRAVQLLLGHTKVESMTRYHGIEERLAWASTPAAHSFATQPLFEDHCQAHRGVRAGGRAPGLRETDRE